MLIAAAVWALYATGTLHSLTNASPEELADQQISANIASTHELAEQAGEAADKDPAHSAFLRQIQSQADKAAKTLTPQDADSVTEHRPESTSPTPEEPPSKNSASEVVEYLSATRDQAAVSATQLTGASAKQLAAIAYDRAQLLAGTPKDLQSSIQQSELPGFRMASSAQQTSPPTETATSGQPTAPSTTTSHPTPSTSPTDSATTATNETDNTNNNADQNALSALYDQEFGLFTTAQTLAARNDSPSRESFETTAEKYAARSSELLTYLQDSTTRQAAPERQVIPATAFKDAAAGQQQLQEQREQLADSYLELVAGTNNTDLRALAVNRLLSLP